MKTQAIRTFLRYLYIVCNGGIIVLGPLLAQPVYAISKNDLQSINYDTPFYDPTASAQTCDNHAPAHTDLTGSDHVEQALNYFISKGLSRIAASAVVGNLYEESAGVNPTIIQNPPGGTTTDPSWIRGPTYQLVGWGIAQWTPGAKVLDIAKSLNITTPISDLATQLNIVWAEMTGTSPTNAHNMAIGLEAKTDLADAVEYFRANFEGGDPSPARLSSAQQVMEKYANSSSVPSSSTIGCNISCPSSGISADSSLRQRIVCIAQQQLALWTPPPAAFSDRRIQLQNLYTDNHIDQSWCANFTSWVYKEAGYPVEGTVNKGWREAWVPTLVVLAKDNNRLHWHPQGTYSPRPGDLTVWDTGNAETQFGHVSIFIGNKGSKGIWIGGNQDGNGGGTGGGGGAGTTSLVDQWILGLSGNGIDGYISPD